MEKQLIKNTDESTKNSEGVPYHRAVVNTHKHQMKSHEYDAALISQMSQRLNAISLSMGFTKVNSVEVVLALSLWIQKHFGDISMQEVSLAFDLVTSKKIGEQIRHYNSFSKQYIGDVLYAFKTYRNRQMVLFKESEAARKIVEGDFKGATGEEMYNLIKKIALEKGEIMRVADWSSAYHYAWREKLIHRMNERERTEYRLSIETAIQSEKMAGILPTTFNIKDSIQSECHKRILAVHFQEIINNKNQ